MAAGAVIPPITLALPATPATPAVAAYTPSSPQLSGSQANPVLFRISGTFAGLQGVFEGSFDLSGAFANPFPIRALQSADGSLVSGVVSVPDSTVANPAAAAYYVYPDSGMAVRFRATQILSGAPVVDGRTTDFFSGPFPSSGLTALLLELQRIRVALTLLLASTDQADDVAKIVPSQLSTGN